MHAGLTLPAESAAMLEGAGWAALNRIRAEK
jgi:hypothetical protein